MKGGHRVEDAMDILYDGSDFHVYKGERIETDNTHGTGCTLSSALAVMLARGLSIADAVTGAKKYISGAIKPILSVMETALSIISGSTGTSGGIWNELSFLRLHGAPEVHRALGADAEFHP